MMRKQIVKAEIEDVNHAIRLAYPGKPYLAVISKVTIINDTQYFDVDDFLEYPDKRLSDEIYNYIASVYATQIKRKRIKPIKSD